MLGGVRAQKPPKKGYFVDAESVRKTSLTFNNYKHYTDEAYHDYVSSWECKPKTSYSQKFIFWLNLFASLVKILYKLDDIWGSIP